MPLIAAHWQRRLSRRRQPAGHLTLDLQSHQEKKTAMSPSPITGR
jgi:hypothetical protein